MVKVFMMFMLKKLKVITRIFSNTLYKDRITICNSCDFYRQWAKQCKVCKCFMPLKARLTTTSCPMGKWEHSYSGWSSI